MSDDRGELDVYTSANQAYFNSVAQKYGEHPHAARIAKKIAAAILASDPFDEESTTVLDFACGIGLISREICPYAKQVVGVDISENMVEQYNASVSNQGIPFDEMHAECIDLKGLPTELNGKQFDVIICANAYHHFPSVPKTTEILARFLKPSGKLFVADLLKPDQGDPQTGPHHTHHTGPHPHLHHHHPHLHQVPHSGHHHHHPHSHSHGNHHTTDHSTENWGNIVAHKGGLTEDEIRNAFTHAQLENFTIKPSISISNHSDERERRVIFIASGTKGAVDDTT